MAAAFASQLATWRAVEETAGRVLSSYSNISERMALLHGGGSGGGGEKVLDDGTTSEAADAIPDSELRLRLSEAHAAELARLERIMLGLLSDLGTVHEKMDGLLDDAMHTAMPATAPVGGIGSHRRLGGGGGGAMVAGRSVGLERAMKQQTTTDAVTRMSDVCGMYSRELWRKEELMQALIAQVGQWWWRGGVVWSWVIWSWVSVWVCVGLGIGRPSSCRS